MPSNPTRRHILQTAGAAAAATALPSFAFPTVNTDSDDTIRVAIVGCGGRGSGAVYNALNTQHGPAKLVAMADVFQDRLDSSLKSLNEWMKDKKAMLDVPKERQFVGFDAYKKAMDSLRPGDVVILTTPPAFRWVHFQYAIAKKLNVFMEKPVTVDGPTSKRMLALGEQASAAGLKVGVGLMSRHMVGLQQLRERIANGELGEIMLMRGYRMHGPAGTFDSTPKPADVSHLEYQIRRFHSFLWASGGCFSDFYIHHVDHLCWLKGALPVNAIASGGRHVKETKEGVPFVDQNFDSYSVEYTFADGTKMMFDGRCIEGAHTVYSSYLHGTKGCAIAARSNDCGGPAAIYDGQNFSGTARWQTEDRSNPYQNEWEVLMKSIRTNTPHNEVRQGVEGSLISSMGRMAAHTGQLITFDAMLNCAHEFAPTVDKLDYGTDAPLMPLANGRYPVAQPGILKDREY